jgi:hypothetical protein
MLTGAGLHPADANFAMLDLNAALKGP